MGLFGHENYQRAGAILLWTQAERVGVVHPGEGCGVKAGAFEYIKGAYKKDR